MRLSVESIARNSSAERKLTVHGIEDAILRLKSEEQKGLSTNHCEEGEKQEEVNWIRNQSRGGRRPWNTRQRGSTRGNGNHSNTYKRKIRCYKCDEMGHYSFECNKQNNDQKKQREGFTGHVKENKSSSSEPEEIFYTWQKEKDQRRKEDGSIDIIIDTGASKSVISRGELETISILLNKSEEKLLDTNQQNLQSKFKFGNGPPIEAEKVIHLPIKWKVLNMTLKMNVLNQKVPTLLGLEAMAKMNAQIDISKQEMKINRTKRKIKINTTGHIVWENVTIDREKTAGRKEQTKRNICNHGRKQYWKKNQEDILEIGTRNKREIGSYVQKHKH